MSIFSSIASSEWIVSNRSAFAIHDRFPVTEGHVLVISRREIATWWDASIDEQVDLMDLVAEVKSILDLKHSPDGYNVGFNAGDAAGQTVDHLHVHVIPRRHGDVEDPRGGVRHVIPGLGNYLSEQSGAQDGSSARRESGSVEDYCLDTTDAMRQRPTAVQTHAAGLNPADARCRHGSWFGMLNSLDLLSDEEAAVFAVHGDVLRAIEMEPITKSYKLVTLRALIADGRLRINTTVQAVANWSRRIVLGDPRLVSDVRSRTNPDPKETTPESWASFWRKNSLVHLARAKGDGPALFDLDGDDFSPTFSVDERLEETFDQMTSEIVDWRLTKYLLQKTIGASSATGPCRA